MHKKSNFKLSIELFINTLGEFSLENIHGRRLQRIFEQYSDQIQISVFDINQEMVRANIGNQLDESVCQMSRVDLANRIGLLKTGNTPSDVKVPQAFLVVTKVHKSRANLGGEEIVEDRSFLGHYSTVQYLEDCGLLPKILTGEICPHFRVFKSTVFYQYCQTDSSLHTAEVCMKCHMLVNPDM